jgi:hypothetical protein
LVRHGQRPAWLHVWSGARLRDGRFWYGHAKDSFSGAIRHSSRSGGQERVSYRLRRRCRRVFHRPAWSIKAEYQYINLGSASLGGSGRTSDGTYSGSLSADHAYHTLRAGLNYHVGEVYELLKWGSKHWIRKCFRCLLNWLRLLLAWIICTLCASRMRQPAGPSPTSRTTNFSSLPGCRVPDGERVSDINGCRRNSGYDYTRPLLFVGAVSIGAPSMSRTPTPRPRGVPRPQQKHTLRSIAIRPSFFMIS